MSLRKISELVLKIDTDKPFAFCKENLGGFEFVEEMLTQTFDTSNITINQVAVTCDESEISICGIAKTLRLGIWNLETLRLKFQFSEEVEEKIKLTVISYIQEYLNPFSWVSDKLGMEVIDIYCKTYISEEALRVKGGIYAGIQIGQTILPVCMEYPFNSSECEFVIGAAIDPEFNFSFKDFPALFRADGISAVIPQSLTDIISHIGIADINLILDLERQNVRSVSVTIAIRQDKSWDVFKLFKISSIMIKFDIRYSDKSEIDFFIKGNFEYGNKMVEAHFHKLSRQSHFTLQAFGDEPLAIKDFSELDALVGNYNFASYLPKDLNALHLTVSNIVLIFNIELISVENFMITVSIESALNLMDIFSVDKISLQYVYYKNDFGLRIIGEFTLSELCFSVSAEKQLAGGWIYQGAAQGSQGISLNRFANDVAREFKMPCISMPSFYLSNLSLSYNSDVSELALKMDLEVEIDTENFLNFSSVHGDLELIMKKKTQKWSFSGVAKGEVYMLSSLFSFEYTFDFSMAISKIHLTWNPESPLHTVDFFRNLGFNDIELPEFLDVSLKMAVLDYNFTTGVLVLRAESNDGASLLFCSFSQGGKRQYVLDVKLAFGFSMARLPVVGDAIPGLDNIVMRDLTVIISTTNIENLSDYVDEEISVQKGLTIVTDLIVFDDVIPINIPFAKSEKQTLYAVPDDSDMPLSNEQDSTQEFWMNIQKSVGPFTLKRIGGKFEDNTVWFAIDAAFEAGGLRFAMDGLSAGYNIKDHSLSLALLGLSAGAKSDVLELSGSFLRKDENTYSGEMLMKMASFTLCAIGGYTVKPQSMFALAFLHANLGGPVCFFVTGIAAGFGFNRSLSVPDIDKLSEFPLLSVASGDMKPSECLDDVSTYFPVIKGSYWIAAGIIFNSFKMIDSVAILTANFGDNMEINLLGRSDLTIPYKAEKPIARAVLLLKASIKPQSSLVAVEAILDENKSFILSPDCHLYGGFAFYTWYAGEHAGDFVLTLGGYRNSYRKPAHYPSVRRLGFLWNISSNLTAAGEMYFALTPSCLMAGGSLEIVYTASRVKAWFTAYMDIYMQWKPYYYELSLGIHIGVYVDLFLFSGTLELGCDLEIWGPEFSGKAHISLWVISFTISFGAGAKRRAEPISWDEFTNSFIPQKQNTNGTFAGCSIQLSDGLINEIKLADDSKLWIICAETMEFITKSVIPSNRIIFNEVEKAEDTNKIGAKPCEIDALNTSHRITLKRKDNLPIACEFDLLPIRENVPTALWGQSDISGAAVQGETLPAYTGAKIRCKPMKTYTVSFEIDCHESQKQVKIADIKPLRKQKYDQDNALQYLEQINTVKNRNIIADLIGLNTEYLSLRTYSENPRDSFVELPFIKSVGG